jgi:hypothetical protein
LFRVLFEDVDGLADERVLIFEPREVGLRDFALLPFEEVVVAGAAFDQGGVEELLFHEDV